MVENDRKSLVRFNKDNKMNELPTGFYTQSRIFCFLPLPVETTLPLHINGCFMVENEMT
jgi:hypothetical protein